MTYKNFIWILVLGISFLCDTLVAQDIPVACGNSSVRYRMRGQPGSTFEWKATGGTIVNRYAAGDSIDVRWNNQRGTHFLSCTETLKTGCAVPEISTLVNVEVMAIDLGAARFICEGEKVELNAGSGFTGYNWKNGSSESFLEASTAGIYWVEVSKGKCTLRDSVEVFVMSNPVVELGRDTSICAPDQLLLDAGNAGMDYAWSNGNRSQTIWASEGDGKIWVKVTDDKNCVSTDTIKILPCVVAQKIIVSNVFTPNGDGKNDIWRIGGMQNYPDAIVKIYDRWGKLIFSSIPGYGKPWNGEVGGELMPMDAYFYIIDLKNGTEPLRGSVTLIP